MNVFPVKHMLQSPLTGEFKEKPTFRVRCLYSSFVHVYEYRLGEAVGQHSSGELWGGCVIVCTRGASILSLYYSTIHSVENSEFTVQ